ncbi:probable cytochrome P450 CYP44 [Neocloeon triangulifer]|uniref:probable cytochrome P450 CYP44 n=1 Tax=Neocloeon triangulifer TaxID=2078957 RepID=UPI00286FA4C6|nr:probable cytochrome P450 CYP44 [Neocloeon triangulifer]
MAHRIPKTLLYAVPAPRQNFSCALSSTLATTTDADFIKDHAKPFSSIPQPPKIPLFGHTLLYHALGPYKIEKYHEALRDLYKKYGPVVRQQLQGGAQGEVVHVFELEDIAKVMAAGGAAPVVPPIQEGSRLYRLMRGHAVGLGNMNGEQWKTLRKASQQQLLKPNHINQFLPSVEKVSQILIDELRARRDKDGAVENFYTLIAKWYLEISGAIMFEKPLGALNGNLREQDEAREWVQANIDIFRLNSKLKVASPLFKVFPIKPWRQLVRAEEKFHHFVEKYLVDALGKIEQLANAGGLDGKFNFLTTMLSKEQISRKDMVFFIHSMFSEGLATVPSTMQSCIYSLMKHPVVQEKLYDEIRQNVDLLQEITPEILDKLSYTKAVIKETFRMFPLGTELSRVAQKTLVLGGYEIPPGTVIDLNHSSLLRSEKYFPEPNKFIPERWLRGDEQATQNAILLTPFGHGARMCVGRRFSQQAMHAGLARLVQRFKFVDEKKEHDLPYNQVYQTLLFPNRELKVKIEYRPQN